MLVNGDTTGRSTAIDQKDFNHTDVNYHATGMDIKFY